MNDEWLITAPVTPGEKPYPRSEVRWCTICAASIWLSQGALRRMDENPRLKPVCLPCAIPMVADHDQVHVSPVDPSAPGAPDIMKFVRSTIQEARKGKRK